MSNPLQKAINALQVQDVYLRNSQSLVADGFEPKYQGQNLDCTLQFKHLVERVEVLEVENGEAEPQKLMRVHIQLGCRLIPPERESTGTDGEEPPFLVQIEAQYIAEYRMAELLDQACIDAFALENASYHVWPYWREYLMSQAMRMNLPKITLPARQLARNHQRES